MSNEISQEAKTSIAQLNQRKARERLERDGAHSSDALRRRVRAIAQERNLPPADIAKLMYKRINTRDVMLFCEKHKVSCDWLLCGDLQGLRRMTRDEIAFRPVLTPEEFQRAYESLDQGGKAFISGYIMTRLAKKGDGPTPAA